MPRGGRRTGTPGASYSNRTDLAVPAMAAKGQQYGAAGAQRRHQHLEFEPGPAEPPLQRLARRLLLMARGYGLGANDQATRRVLAVTQDYKTRYLQQAAYIAWATKRVRGLCIFARQNLVSHPPFSRMDLISCRNVLIYLGPALQQRVLATLHYALNTQAPDAGNMEILRDHATPAQRAQRAAAP